MKYKYITIEGNIGSGKTSFARKLSEKFESKLLLEEFETNPFLSKFYEDPEKNSLPLELYFLSERYNQLNKYKTNTDLFYQYVIADHSFFKSKLFAQNNLNKEELNLFEKLYNIMSNNIRESDLLIYLHSDIDRIIKNIKNRGRIYEQNINEKYLKSIEEKYFDYIKKQDKTPVIIFDITNIDFVKEEIYFYRILEEIQQFNKDEGIKTILF
tara:strand:+ start:38493 stop:39128 length:636 start_codon:yes stop_codon:yes gene_type:complete